MGPKLTMGPPSSWYSYSLSLTYLSWLLHYGTESRAYIKTRPIRLPPGSEIVNTKVLVGTSAGGAFPEYMLFDLPWA